MQQLLLAVLVVALPAGAHAGLTGVGVGAGIWNHDPRGHVASEGDRADVEDALQIGSERGFFVWADLRHAVPVLPRLKFQYTPLRLTGSGTASRNFRFAGVTFDGETNVGSEIELDQTDMILYWSPWRLLADIDVGVNVKYLDGLVEVEDRDSGDRARVSFSGPLPMLYGRTEVRFPGTGFFGGGEGSLLAYDGHRILDLTLRLGYRAGYGVGSLALEGGWKHQSIRLDDFDDLDADMTVEGPYLGVAARF
ncbi:TIGR04219 family outer membrane beta-barrel protein [Aquisalimonas sp.]|uniref:TIGR04219 family outer membrane beta-barrel protein n=1 Tax=Aquisalimonas sp. TaxID=1872621 RepID=UPI0025BE0127|nr:TIGR04219 family outer membrane beta-barrel protein [Aquisalimonas sp.]